MPWKEQLLIGLLCLTYYPWEVSCFPQETVENASSQGPHVEEATLSVWDEDYLFESDDANSTLQPDIFVLDARENVSEQLHNYQYYEDYYLDYDEDHAIETIQAKSGEGLEPKEVDDLEVSEDTASLPVIFEDIAVNQNDLEHLATDSPDEDFNEQDGLAAGNYDDDIKNVKIEETSAKFQEAISDDFQNADKDLGLELPAITTISLETDIEIDTTEFSAIISTTNNVVGVTEPTNITEYITTSKPVGIFIDFQEQEAPKITTAADYDVDFEENSGGILEQNYPRVPRQNDIDGAQPLAGDDQDATAEVNLEAGAGLVGADARAKTGDNNECEESWDYIQFLRESMSGKSEAILEDIRRRRASIGDNLQESISKILREILAMRSETVDRMTAIRKGSVEICGNPDIRQEEMLNGIRIKLMDVLQSIVDNGVVDINMLKSTRDRLLNFRVDINNEIMRVLMLPQSGARTRTRPGECGNCQIIAEIRAELSRIMGCAGAEEELGIGPRYGLLEPDDEEEVNEEDNQIREDAEGSGLDTEGTCSPPQMFFMELILLMRRIDNETEVIFGRLFGIVAAENREESETTLNTLKSVREMMESTVQKLANTRDVDDLKRTIVKDLEEPRRELTQLIKSCNSQCGSGGSCNSCGADVTEEMIDRLSSYMESYNSSEDGKSTNDFVRGDLIQQIKKYSREEQEILSNQIQGKATDCDLEKLQVFNRTKNPLWMIVNTTIFAPDGEEPKVLIDTMLELLEQIQQEFCSEEPTKRRTGDSCQWDEYQQTSRYVEKIDNIIQDNLFKPEDDSDVKKVQTGFIDIKRMLDRRVELLFAEKLTCPEEALLIKKTWMLEVDRCLSTFMDPDIKLTKMPRSSRISCTKNLRGQMENRRTSLLELEVERSLDSIDENLGGEGINYS